MGNNEWHFSPRDLVTVPNLLTYLRFLLVAPFIYFFLNENYIMAAVCIGLSGLSDCLDGFFARRFNQVTSLGKILDPIADKVTLVSVAICMLIYMPSLLPIMLVMIGKEFIMLLGGMILLAMKITPPPARWYGKVATIIFYVSVCTIIFLRAAFNIQNDFLITATFIITAAAMVFALVMYVILIVRQLRNPENSVK
ncbi:MAG: CDP-alcohol phosphatidyltransferase family protein [Ruminococcus sp.]|nr:CDP-alcohol phosphatidyltransferase family protein [Ruminococcus sp.]